MAHKTLPVLAIAIAFLLAAVAPATAQRYQEPAQPAYGASTPHAAPAQPRATSPKPVACETNTWVPSSPVTRMVIEWIDEARQVVRFHGSEPHTNVPYGPYEASYRSGTFGFTTPGNFMFEVTVRERDIVTTVGAPMVYAGRGGTVWRCSGALQNAMVTTTRRAAGG